MRIAKNFTHRASRAFAIAAMAVGMHAAQAYSVSLAPASQTVFQGAMVTVSVTAADVMTNNGLGAYNFDLVFDSTVLSFASGASAFAMGDSLGLFADAIGGALTVLEFSEELNPSALLALQQAEFDRGASELTLFTLVFNAIGPGTTILSFNGGAMFDVEGFNEKNLALGEIAASNASITVLENLTVPTPGTLALVLVAGLAARAGRHHSATRAA